MSVEKLPWWEREKLLTPKDKEAIQRAIYTRWEDIDENDAETEAGRYELRTIALRKYHNDEFKSGIS